MAFKLKILKMTPMAVKEEVEKSIKSSLISKSKLDDKGEHIDISYVATAFVVGGVYFLFHNEELEFCREENHIYGLLHSICENDRDILYEYIKTKYPQITNAIKTNIVLNRI